jgi:hypothetical protein
MRGRSQLPTKWLDHKKRLFLLSYDTQIFHVCIPLSPNTTSDYRSMRSHVLLVESNATRRRSFELSKWTVAIHQLSSLDSQVRFALG